VDVCFTFKYTILRSEDDYVLNTSFEHDVEMGAGGKVVIATISDTDHKDVLVQSVGRNRDRI
jgi:hypothetical protein